MQRLVSPVFAGREEELRFLLGAFTDAGARTPRTCLVAAEAGGGKSRLVCELAARVLDRARVLEGGCTELSDTGLPYAPFVAIVRRLIRDVGVATIRTLVGEAGARELAQLLPDFGMPEGSSGDRESARARFFEVVLNLLERLAVRRPLVLIVEDLHWSDASTRDLLQFLVRNLDGPILLIATFRPEELNRSAPLRSMLAEVSRLDGVSSLMLPPLTSQEIAAQLRGILGHVPDPAVVQAMHFRGGGIPLFTEALIGRDGRVRPSLPGPLRNVLLSAVKELPGQTQKLLRIAAAAGTQIDHALLAVASGCNDESTTDALRFAVEANTLRSTADGYAFRHDLIREAIEDDLIAGERTQVHRALATALETHPVFRTDRWLSFRLALHWRRAGDYSKALHAAWRAAADASAVFAYPEQLQMLEQVLELWPLVADPTNCTGAQYLEIVERAADVACWATETERGTAHVTAALSLLEETEEKQRDGERIAALLLQRAALRQQVLHAGQLDDLRSALDLARNPTRTRAETLGQLCRALIFAGLRDDAAPLAAQLSTLSRQLGDDEFRIEATITAAQLRCGEDASVSALETALRDARRSSFGRLEVLAYIALTDALGSRGDHRRAIELGRVGLERAAHFGQARYRGVLIAQNVARALASDGRWDEALNQIDEALSLDPASFGRAPLLICRGQIAVWRGDLETAAGVLDDLRPLPGGPNAEMHRVLPLAVLEIEYRLADGNLAGAVALAVQTLTSISDGEPRYAWPLLLVAVRSCVELQLHGLEPDSSIATRHLRSLLDTIEPKLPRGTRLYRAYAATYAAEAFGPGTAEASSAWASAANGWDELGHPYAMAYALTRAAAATAQDREAAATLLRRAFAIAAELAAKPLVDQISLLAQRSRIDLGKAEGGPSTTELPFGLTRRELEVLQLVAAGRSNRQIASELFISPKTASVHVSNILGKLGVLSRGAAAATAHKARLFERQPGRRSEK